MEDSAGCFDPVPKGSSTFPLFFLLTPCDLEILDCKVCVVRVVRVVHVVRCGGVAVLFS